VQSGGVRALGFSQGLAKADVPQGCVVDLVGQRNAGSRRDDMVDAGPGPDEAAAGASGGSCPNRLRRADPILPQTRGAA
jgi:hypothetical protein